MKSINATKINRKFGKPSFLPRCSATQPRVRFSVGENRMKSTNATKINRKFGKPSFLLCALPPRKCFLSVLALILCASGAFAQQPAPVLFGNCPDSSRLRQMWNPLVRVPPWQRKIPT